MLDANTIGRRMPWLDLHDAQGHRVQLSVDACPYQDDHGRHTTSIEYCYTDTDGERHQGRIPADSIYAAERTLSVIENLVSGHGRWETRHAGSDGSADPSDRRPNVLLPAPSARDAAAEHRELLRWLATG